MSINIATDKDTHVNQTMEYLDENFHVRPEFWGRDHWSTFAYALCCVRKACVENRRYGKKDDTHGWVKKPQMRTNSLRHRHLAFHPSWRPGGDADPVIYPTRLKAGIQIHWHDDWDCLRDLEAYGLLKLRVDSSYVEITDAGVDVAKQIFRQVSTRQPRNRNIFLATKPVWDSFNRRDKVHGEGFRWSDLKVNIPGYEPNHDQ